MVRVCFISPTRPVFGVCRICCSFKYRCAMLRIILIIFACVACEAVFSQNDHKHTLQRGETLEFVAQMYGVSVDAIKEANPHLKGFYTGIVCVIPDTPIRILQIANLLLTSQRTHQIAMWMNCVQRPKSIRRTSDTKRRLKPIRPS